jgi:hypothetical protein
MQVWRLTTHHIDPRKAAEICASEGFVAVGFGAIGDLGELGKLKPKSTEDIEYAIRRTRIPGYMLGNRPKRGAKSLWGLLKQMQTDDLVILSAGGRRTAVMQVTGNYYWLDEEDTELGDYQHRRRAGVQTAVDPDKLWHRVGGFPNGGDRYCPLVLLGEIPSL